MGNANNPTLAVLRDAIAIVATASALVLYWGYVTVQAPLRPVFGTSLPFPTQDYWFSGLEPVTVVIIAAILGFQLGVAALESTRGHSFRKMNVTYWVCNVISLAFRAGQLTPALGGWFAVISLFFSLSSLSFAMAYIVGGINYLSEELSSASIRADQTEAEMKKLIKKISGLEIEINSERKPADDLNRHLVNHTLEVVRQEQDAMVNRMKDTSQDLKQILGQFRFKRVVFILYVVLLLVNFEGAATATADALGKIDQMSTKYPTVRVVTDKVIPELTNVSQTTGNFAYELVLVLESNNQLYVYDPKTKLPLIIPLKDVSRQILKISASGPKGGAGFPTIMNN